MQVAFLLGSLCGTKKHKKANMHFHVWLLSMILFAIFISPTLFCKGSFGDVQFDALFIYFMILDLFPHRFSFLLIFITFFELYSDSDSDSDHKLQTQLGQRKRKL